MTLSRIKTTRRHPATLRLAGLAGLVVLVPSAFGSELSGPVTDQRNPHRDISAEKRPFLKGRPAPASASPSETSDDLKLTGIVSVPSPSRAMFVRTSKDGRPIHFQIKEGGAMGGVKVPHGGIDFATGTVQVNIRGWLKELTLGTARIENSKATRSFELKTAPLPPGFVRVATRPTPVPNSAAQPLVWRDISSEAPRQDGPASLPWAGAVMRGTPGNSPPPASEPPESAVNAAQANIPPQGAVPAEYPVPAYYVPPIDDIPTAQHPEAELIPELKNLPGRSPYEQMTQPIRRLPPSFSHLNIEVDLPQ